MNIVPCLSKVKIHFLVRETFKKDFLRIELAKIYLPVKRNVVTLPKFELEFYLTKAEFTARYKSAFGI